jgi:putative transposase
MLGWADERKINLVNIQPGRPMQNGRVESFHGRLRDECLNLTWLSTSNDARRTLDNNRQEFNCEWLHSLLAYRTPAEFRRTLGHGDVEGIQRFPHSHRPDYDSSEIYSPSNLNRETPAMIG